MNSIKEKTVYDTLADTARVWVYQAQRSFNKEDIPQIKQDLERFAESWTSHNRQLKAYAAIYYDQFVVLMVDENEADASGCSIDASVRFIKQLEQKYAINLFDRLTFAYKDGDIIKTAPRPIFADLYQAGQINDDTPVFDNLVKTKAEFEKMWLKPLGRSWHKRMV